MALITHGSCLQIVSYEDPLPRPSPPSSSFALLYSCSFSTSARPNLQARRCLSQPTATNERHRILFHPLADAYRHRLSRCCSSSTKLRSIGESVVLELFLMENQVTNLLKYSIISYPSPSAPFNHPAEITVDSFFF